jgi:hypothetical protein
MPQAEIRDGVPADERKHDDGTDDEGRNGPTEQGTHHRGGTPFAINPGFAERTGT